jgi:hypothetical protein
VDGSSLYRDGDDPELRYLDPSEAGPARGNDIAHWLALDDGRFQLAAEVRFGFHPVAAQAVSLLRPELRLAAMPWQSAPVFAFAPVDGLARLVARGRTSGFGAHNAVLSATVAAETAAAPLIIAAELSCPARLSGARLAGEGRGPGVVSALQQLALGAYAPADATLGEVLLAILRHLLQRGVLALSLEASGLSLAGPEAMREAALLHWARTIADTCLHGASLALPAQQADLQKDCPEPDLAFAWQPGMTVTWRALRRVIARPAAEPAAAKEPAPPGVTRIVADGAWEQFDFVTVSLGGQQVALTRQSPEAAAPPAGADERPRATGALKGYGASIPLATQLSGELVRVALPALSEVALLIQADRRLVDQVGPLEVTLDHPGLVAQLMPRGRPLRLGAETGGDRPKVSAVYRTLLRREQAAAPFRLTVAPARGAVVSWTVDAGQERVEISRNQLPVLDVLAALPEGERVLVEAAQEADGRPESLGRHELVAGSLGCWAYRPAGGRLMLRTTQGDYTTGWQVVSPEDGAVVAPRVGRHQIAIHGASEATEVELKSAAGEGQPLRQAIGPGQALSIVIPQDAGSDSFLMRRRPAGSSTWSEWQPGAGHVLYLDTLAA